MAVAIRAASAWFTVGVTVVVVDDIDAYWA